MRSERRSLQIDCEPQNLGKTFAYACQELSLSGARHCCCMLHVAAGVAAALAVGVAVAVANIAASPVAWLRLAAGFLCQPPASRPDPP